MTVTLYYIPELQINKNQTIKFSSSTQRDNYFAAITKQKTLSYIGDTYDVDLLENEIGVDLTDKDYNYCVITQDTSFKHYYYIVGSDQRGAGQVALLLYKDTFMTYMSVDNIGFSIGWKPSLVVREHKNRFTSDTTPRIIYNEFPEKATVEPYIINTTVLGSGVRARFVYRNRSKDWKPVAYVYSETTQSVSWTGDDWVANLKAGSYVNQIPFYVWDGDYEYTLNPSATPNIPITDTWSTYFHILIPTVGGGSWQVVRMKKSDGEPHSVVLNLPAAAFNFKIKLGTQSTNKIYYVNYVAEEYITWSDIESNYTALNNEATGTGNLPTFSSIDIYDAANEKVVEIPYLDTTMSFKKDGFGIYVDLEEKNEVSISFNLTTIFDTSKVDKNRVVTNDPKLFHSQFAPYFIVFNGHTIGIKREWINKAGGVTNGNTSITIDFIVSLTQPSLFNYKLTIPSYVTHNVDELIGRVMVNNEVSTVKDEAYTFNEYYRDLDDKTRKIQEDASARNLVLGSINQVTSIVGGAFGIGAATSPGMRTAQLGARAIGAGINIANSVMEHQDMLKQNQINYEQKYIGLMLQASQVSGSNLDFVRANNIDKFRAVSFQLRGFDLNYWDNYFHKFGYQTLEYKIPTLKTRKYFDYKQIITDEFIQDFGLKQDCIDDLKGRFAQGITIYHCQEDLSIDWQQLKENWEV